MAIFLTLIGGLRGALFGSLVAVTVGLLSWKTSAWINYSSGQKSGRETLLAEQAAKAAEKTNDAIRAETEYRNCVRDDVSCRMRSDGHRRD